MKGLRMAQRCFYATWVYKQIVHMKKDEGVC